MSEEKVTGATGENLAAAESAAGTETTTAAESAAEAVITPEPGKKKKRMKFHEYTIENDMKYKAPLNYQTFQVLGWLCMVTSIVVLMINIGGRLNEGVTKQYGGIADVLSYFAEMSVPFLLIANFSKILNNSEGFKKQLLRNGGAALAIFVVTIVMGNRYIVGTVKQMVVQKDQVVPMLTALFQGVKQEGFLAFNLFIDLFLCTLTLYFLNARPKRVFTGKKIIFFRLFAILPIAYEVVCLYLKIQSARGKIMLPLWSFPLLTMKPPMTFAFFVFIALLVRVREYRYCKHGNTHDDYVEFMKSRRNSFHLSVHMCIWMIVFALIDFVLLLLLTAFQAESLVQPGADEASQALAIMSGLQVAQAVGIGGAISLALVAPLMLLYSYNTQPKYKVISLLAPAVGIVLMILVVLESVRMGVGMFMAGKEIDLSVITDGLKSLFGE